MAISPLPTPPSRQRPAEFSNEADAFLGALPTFRTEANALASDVNSKQIAAAASASTATSEADRATAQANASAASAVTAGNYATNSANSATDSENSAVASASSAAQSASSATASQNSAMASASSASLASSEADRAEAAADSIAGGPVASVNGLTGIVTLTAADIGPAATQAEAEAGTETGLRMWSPNRVAQAISSLSGAKIFRSARTSNVQLTKADNGNLIDITSGTFTQTFDPASTLGDGWFCYIRNSGTGDITLDPNASETIDGLTSYIMYPGEVRLVQCDGVALRTVVLNRFYKVFPVSGAFIKPPGYSFFEGLLWAGGASGRRGATNQARPGGGGGACAPLRFGYAELLQSESFTIGAGGASVTTDATNGNKGGNSVFKTITAYGGKASSFSGSGGGAFFDVTTLQNAVIGGSGTGGASMGSFYGGGSGFGNTSEGNGQTVYGGCGGQGIDASNVLVPLPVTVYGGLGGITNASGTAPTDGQAPGGGGGASTNGTPSGAGARGELRIWGII